MHPIIEHASPAVSLLGKPGTRDLPYLFASPSRREHPRMKLGMEHKLPDKVLSSFVGKYRSNVRFHLRSRSPNSRHETLLLLLRDRGEIPRNAIVHENKKLKNYN